MFLTHRVELELELTVELNMIQLVFPHPASGTKQPLANEGLINFGKFFSPPPKSLVYIDVRAKEKAH